MLEQLQGILDGAAARDPEEEILSFPEYLELVRKEPWVTRNTFQLLHDMLLSSGVEYSVVPGKPLKHRYGFFEDDNLVGIYEVFGQQKAKENMVEKRPIRMGQLVDGLRVIEEGVQPGERVVVNGLQRARPGAKVDPEGTDMKSLTASALKAKAKPSQEKASAAGGEPATVESTQKDKKP